MEIQPKDDCQYGSRPPCWICCDVIILHPGIPLYVPNIVLNFKSIGLVISDILGLPCFSILA